MDKIIDNETLKYYHERNIATIVNMIYPIGSIYMSVNNINPSNIFGFGEWEQIKDTFLLACGDNHIAGTFGGEETVKLNEQNLPAHTHTRGTMNITGVITERHLTQSMELLKGYGSFSTKYFDTIIPDDEYPDWKVTVANDATPPTHSNNMHFFDASKTWEGETSVVGNNVSHNNMPPYLAVYMGNTLLKIYR